MVLCLAAGSAGAVPVEFNRDIRPILAKNCFACHGQDAKKRKGKLRLDQEEAAFAPRDDGAAIVPEKVKESEMWRRITSGDPDEVMPPVKSKKNLSAVEKNTIKLWIEQGAKYEKHWAFIAPRKPKVAGTGNPIDAFLQQRLAKEGLKPAPLASPETLVRRVYLDLTGLPPTPKEVDEFLGDKSSDALEKLIARLMKRQTYGEHMARYWLDLARYADTHGLHLDNERSMWPYRDWVVRAFNQNLRFDEFTRWQLAGDLMPKATMDQKIASGFNRCNVSTGEGGSITAEWIYRNAVDRTSTAVEVWMGMTAGCAVCHDHKFDPLSTKEYYSMYSFFHSAADPALDGNKINTPPILRVPMPGADERLAELDAEIAKVNQRISAEVAKIKYVDPASLDPLPKPKRKETLWFEDGFPKGKLQVNGPPLQLITKEQGPVFSGKRAITRTAMNARGQDVFSEGAPLTIPKGGKFFVHCYLDPENPPEAVMVQFYVGGWKHRVVWGAHEKIGWGKVNTYERVNMGPLPEKGKWVRLEFPAAKVGLKPEYKVTGYAFTQFSGKMGWDHFGIVSTTDPVKDTTLSWKAWKGQAEAARNKDLTEALRKRFKGKAPATWTKAQDDLMRNHWLANVYNGAGETLGPLAMEKEALEKKKAAVTKNTAITFVMADLPKARQSFVMIRGQYDNPGEKVSRGVPAFLPALPPKPKDRDYNRLDLANWLVRDDHPLTARVAVNRIWQQFFGTGLVRTSADFGTQGELPSHPELLDWLALRFIEDDWNVQRFVKCILTSHAYRQSTKVTPALLEKDPENRLLARGSRHRLDAEIIRDQALSLSGLLVPTVGGKGVLPYQPPNIWEPVGFGRSNTRFYKQGKGDDLYRRSLYTFLKRTAPAPFMASFDAPNREQSCTARGRSNTPMQALQLMNDVQHVEAARNLAQRILKEGGAKDNQRIQWAWRTVTSRRPAPDEAKIITDVLKGHRSRYAEDLEAAKQLIAYGESVPDKELAPHELASWTLVANLLLNLDEVVNKN